MFEMKYVKLKSESSSIEHYKKAKKPIKIIKYLIITVQLFIQLPLGIISQGLSNQDDRASYYYYILTSLVITRICYLIVDTYAYSEFAKLFSFFYKKKLELIR